MIGKGFWQKRYVSKFTGREIDEGVQKALDNKTIGYEVSFDTGDDPISFESDTIASFETAEAAQLYVQELLKNNTVTITGLLVLANVTICMYRGGYERYCGMLYISDFYAVSGQFYVELNDGVYNVNFSGILQSITTE